MKLEELALLTREEIEKEIYRCYPDPSEPANPYEIDQAGMNRIRLHQEISRLQIEALLDGKLSIDQVVEQNHDPNADPREGIDDIHRKLLEQALLDYQKSEKDRYKIVSETVYHLGLL